MVVAPQERLTIIEQQAAMITQLAQCIVYEKAGRRCIFGPRFCLRPEVPDQPRRPL